MSDRLTILQVGTADTGGGAERVAVNLHRGYAARGHRSFMAVGRKRGDDPATFEIPNAANRSHWSRVLKTVANRIETIEDFVPGAWRVRRALHTAAEPTRWWNERTGREYFDFPGTRDLLALPPAPPDVLHLHNLHGDYFDLRALPALSRRVPTVVSLHDAWLLSGHCAHSLDCDRWQTGCGACPHLELPPVVRRDATAENWRRKTDIFSRSRLYVTTPSRWLMRKVERSMLAPAVVEGRVIPNGVDLTVFKPGSQRRARRELGLDADARVVVFASNGVRKSAYKDYETLRAAVVQAAARVVGRRVVLLALGEDAATETHGNAEIRFVPFRGDPVELAKCYAAGDVYAHAAKADTFPTTVLEALACGLPVVASHVGGIPEQVDHGVTGFLTPAGEPAAMAEAIAWLLNDEVLRSRFSIQAARSAAARFNFERQVDETLAWYRRIAAAEADGSIPLTVLRKAA